MADESQQPCVMCHQPNQQMLMLSCVHDPCVNCAATHYVENQPHNSPIYTCAKCGQETQLDQSSIAELRRIYSLLKNKKKTRNPPSTVSQKDRAQKRDFTDSYHERESYYPKTRTKQPVSSVSRKKEVEQTPSSKYYVPNPVSQPSYTSGGSKHSSYQPTYPCKDHQEEQLTYFCFTCNRPICPECAIHGSHKDHQVETTRKAIKHIKQLLVEDKQKLEGQLNSLGSNRDSAKKLSKEWVDENKRDQDYIRKKMAQIRTVISEKQRELLRATEVNLQKNTQILRTEATASDRALQNIIAVTRAIDNTLKKDQLTILHQFNKRDEETNQAIGGAEKDKDKLRQQQIKNPLKALELDLLEQDLDRIIGELQNLKLSTTPLKS